MSDPPPPAPARAGGSPRGGPLDHFFALRPLLWIPAIALFEAGRVEGGGSPWPPSRALPALASLLAILGAVHLANAWNDREGDRRNRKGGAVASGALPGRSLAARGVALLLLALAAALCPLVSPGARLALLAALGLGAAYAAPPFEWKRRAGLDLLAQAAGYGVVAFLLGVESSPSAGRPFPENLPGAIPYASGIATVGLLTMLADRFGDEGAGQRTTVVALGPRRAANAALGLAAGTSAAGFALGAWAPALWGLLAVGAIALFGPAAAATGLEESGREREAWNRLAIRLQIAFVTLLLPLAPIPLLAAGGIGVAAALHDRSRGGRGYPWRSGARGVVGTGAAERAEAERG